MRTSQLHIDFLFRLLGESLFPMLLVDHSGTNRGEKPSLIHLPPDSTPLGLFQAMFWKVYTGEIHSFSRVSWLLANFWFGVSKRVECKAPWLQFAATHLQLESFSVG